MKIKHLLIGMLAIAGAVACKQDEPVQEPKLDVDKAAVEVAATAGEATFNVTSNQSWVASADADWVSLEPASGSASEKAVAVKVTAEDNETTEAREATVTVKAGDLSKTVKVKQAAGQGGDTPGTELPQSEWALVGSFNDWSAGSELYLSVLDEEYFVYYGFELAANDEFKFLKGGVWPPEGQEIGGNGLVEPNTIQPAGGSNIKVTEAGKYDIYLAADLTKFYIMSEGKLPAEATEPAPVENQWGMMGCFVDNQWATDVPMTKEGEWIVAKGAQFTELTFKIRANASWADATNIGRAPGSERAVVNGKIEVVTAEYAKANLGGDAADIKLNGEPGTYDVYFSYDNLELYVMTPGYMPGETPEPEVPGEMQGDGTEANPYILKTAEHMTQMREKAPLGETTWFKMANDIDMASITNWVPVNYDQEYKRQIHFDGGNYTLSNFAPQTYTNVQEDGTEVTAGYHSLFGILYGSCKNLKIKNVTITATNGCGVIGGYVGTTGLPGLVENVTVTNASITNSGDRAGGICGNAKEATFKNVSFQGTVISTYTAKEARSGGFAGITETTAVFENCSADVVLTGDSQDLGGFVGKTTGDVTFTGCKVKATITSNAATKNRCGGFIGWNSTGAATFTDCHVLEGSTITNTTGRGSVSNGNFGGFIGFGDTNGTVLEITDCSAHVDMTVDANSTYNGGFIGGNGYTSTTTIRRCSAAGTVNGNNYVGGFFGAVQAPTVIEQCFSAADVTSTGQRSGSFVGVATAAITIRDCYSTGDITANGQQVGGILGYTGKVASVIERCYATGNVTSNTAGTGGILGTNQIAGTKVSKCIAWNQNITCNRAGSDKWAPGAVVGASDKNGTFEDCYRRADMNFVDAAGAMVLVDHENVSNGLPAAPEYSSEATQAAYHGKAAAADATVSSVAKELGWDETIWDLSGAFPVLK